MAALDPLAYYPTANSSKTQNIDTRMGTCKKEKKETDERNTSKHATA